MDEVARNLATTFVFLSPLLGITLTIRGGRELWRSVRLLRLAEAQKAWLSTSGRIVSSNLRAHSRISGGRRTPQRIVTTYEAQVKYEYVIGGRTCIGNRISAVPPIVVSQSHAQNMIDNRYAPGNVVTVFYNPAKPQEAVLDTQPFADVPKIAVAMFTLAVGLVFLAFSMWLVLFLQLE